MFKLFIKTIISFQGYALPFPFFSVISGCGWKFKKLCTIGKKGFVVYRGEFSHSVMSNFLWSPWTVACQAPLFMEFSRQGYWSGLPFPTSGDLPNPGIEPGSPALQADSLSTELRGNLPWREFKISQNRKTIGTFTDCLIRRRSHTDSTIRIC